MYLFASLEQMAHSHYLDQCWNVVSWTLRNKLQWNFNRNSYFFVQDNAFQNTVYKMTIILSWLQFVNCKLWEPIDSRYPFHKRFMSPWSKIGKTARYSSSNNHNLMMLQFCICHVVSCWMSPFPEWPLMIYHDTPWITSRCSTTMCH